MSSSPGGDRNCLSMVESETDLSIPTQRGFAQASSRQGNGWAAEDPLPRSGRSAEECRYARRISQGPQPFRRR